MKFISANPSLVEVATAYAQANPTEFYFGSVIALGAICYVLKHAF